MKRWLFGDLYRVTLRLYVQQGISSANFPHEMYVRAKSKELAKAKALKKLSHLETFGIEVVSAVYLGE